MHLRGDVARDLVDRVALGGRQFGKTRFDNQFVERIAAALGARQIAHDRMGVAENSERCLKSGRHGLHCRLIRNNHLDVVQVRTTLSRFKGESVK